MEIGGEKFEVIGNNKFGLVLQPDNGPIDIESLTRRAIDELMTLGEKKLIIQFENTYFPGNNDHLALPPREETHHTCLWHEDLPHPKPVKANLFTTNGGKRHPTAFAHKKDIAKAISLHKEKLKPEEIEKTHPKIPDELSELWNEYLSLHSESSRSTFDPTKLQSFYRLWHKMYSRYERDLNNQERTFLFDLRTNLLSLNTAITRHLKGKVFIFQSRTDGVKANALFAVNERRGDKSILHRRKIDPAVKLENEDALYNIEFQ